MADVRELRRQARAFAEDIEVLLNRTVCDNARSGSLVLDDRHPAAIVGTCVSDRCAKTSPVELRSYASTPLWIDVGYRVTLDEVERKFLTVVSSWFSVSVGPGHDRVPVVHYDYERGKWDKDGYPEAHIQVFGHHPEFIAYASELDAKDQLGRYHLPVGGRRMRPALEDVLEFLIAEDLVEPHDDAMTVLDVSRKDYRRRQIQALVRRNIGTAIKELERLGYKVTDPKDQKLKTVIKQLLGKIPYQVGRKSKVR